MIVGSEEVTQVMDQRAYNHFFICSGLMKPDAHLGKNARQIEMTDDQTTPYLFR